jgi:DnaJ-class molecular chaperone
MLTTSTLPAGEIRSIFWGMPVSVKPTDYECPVCQGRDRVPGRLPGRTQLCPECHGTGRVTPIRREALLKKAKQRV